MAHRHNQIAFGRQKERENGRIITDIERNP